MENAMADARFRKITVFVSSPSDVETERKLLDEVVEEINQTIGEKSSFLLKLFKWEEDVVPQIAQRPQGVIDSQMPDYDLYLGIFSTRFGTPTDSYGSGTEQEFRTALDRFNREGKPWISFYFNNGPVQLRTREEREQYNKVCDFREELERQGVVGSYKEIRGSRDAFFEQVRRNLTKIVQRINEKSEKEESERANQLKDEVTLGAPPPSALDSATVVQDIPHPIFDLIGPSYILDSNYYFLDWNPAFDVLIAKPLGLARADHVVDFIKRLENCNDVVERSKKVFALDKDPLVDTEALLFRSPVYGPITFRKIAALINDQKGNPLAWSVNLNIVSVEEEAKLWQDLEKKLREDVNWSRYAVSYDKLLVPFTDYNELVDLVVSQVGDVQLCADLGAGTGNATLKLLQTQPSRQVWAVESNEKMLEFMKQKLGQNVTRLTAIKDDVTRLGVLGYQSNYFDGAIMLNVLYAVQDPLGCLRQAFRILKPGGVLSLSTPHRDTDVRKLLTKLRAVLQSKGLFNSLANEFETARRVHENMDHLIHRDTKEDIRKYIREAGFEIQDWRDSEYVDTVVVVKAVKPIV
jgi:ubiquinone/menaquinone biosynthesis C-methylase UbiE